MVLRKAENAQESATANANQRLCAQLVHSHQRFVFAVAFSCVSPSGNVGNRARTHSMFLG
jgi:hypothetical protein